MNVETESYSKIEDKRREDGVMTRILQLIRDSKEVNIYMNNSFAKGNLISTL